MRAGGARCPFRAERVDQGVSNYGWISGVSVAGAGASRPGAVTLQLAITSAGTPGRHRGWARGGRKYK
jgi:hypothetical protein